MGPIFYGDSIPILFSDWILPLNKIGILSP